MHQQIVQKLCRLASDAYHESYIVNATKDMYVIPDELIEDVSASRTATSLPPAEKNALNEMLQEIEKHILPEARGTELVKSPAWLAVRDAARKCLYTFGISSVSEIDNIAMSSD